MDYMLELLILAACTQNNLDSCTAASTSYYKATGIEQVLTERGQHYILKYPVLGTTLAYAAGAAQGKIIINLGHGRVLTGDAAHSTIGLGTAF